MKKPLTYKELLTMLAEYPAKSIRMRDIGGRKVEVLSIVNGSITTLGFLRLSPPSEGRSNGID